MRVKQNIDQVTKPYPKDRADRGLDSLKRAMAYRTEQEQQMYTASWNPLDPAGHAPEREELATFLADVLVPDDVMDGHWALTSRTCLVGLLGLLMERGERRGRPSELSDVLSLLPPERPMIRIWRALRGQPIAEASGRRAREALADLIDEAKVGDYPDRVVSALVETSLKPDKEFRSVVGSVHWALRQFRPPTRTEKILAAIYRPWVRPVTFWAPTLSKDDAAKFIKALYPNSSAAEIREYVGRAD
mgnify:FL=1